MNDMPNYTQQLTESFLSALKNKHIRYCILRNTDEIKRGDAHDIDMCIDASYLQEAQQLLHEVANAHHFKQHMRTGIIKDRHNIKCHHYYHIDNKERKITIVHIDIFPAFTWSGYELLTNEQLLHNVKNSGLYINASDEISAVVNLFTGLLFNGTIKEKYKPHILHAFNNSVSVQSLLLHFLNEKEANMVLHSVKNADWNHIIQCRSLIIESIQNKATSYRVLYFWYLLSKAVRMAGTIIAFQGTDGSGKSTIINELTKTLGNSFSGNTINHYHWRPGFLKAERRAIPERDGVVCASPQTQPLHGKCISYLKLIFHTLDYILGYWGKIRWDAAKGRLVIFDRYFYDFYIDKKRYRLNIHNIAIRFLQLFIHKPSVTFILIGDAKLIYERKKELPLEETQRQINELKRCAAYIPNAHFVDVSRCIPEVVFETSKVILETMQKKSH